MEEEECCDSPCLGLLLRRRELRGRFLRGRALMNAGWGVSRWAWRGMANYMFEIAPSPCASVLLGAGWEQEKFRACTGLPAAIAPFSARSLPYRGDRELG